MSADKRSSIARRAASDLPDGAYVNLGIGLPTLVTEHLGPDTEIIIHSENGLLGVGPPPSRDAIDPDLINAGKEPVTLLPGAAIFNHTDAFMMMRGGHLDYALLGAFQVSARGDLANWSTGAAGKAPAVGGAMDLAVGAKAIWVLMEHVGPRGEFRILDECRYPLTAAAVVRRIYTDLATIDITGDGLTVRALIDGVDFDHLQSLTGAPLHMPAAQLR